MKKDCTNTLNHPNAVITVLQILALIFGVQALYGQNARATNWTETFGQIDTLLHQQKKEQALQLMQGLTSQTPSFQNNNEKASFYHKTQAIYAAPELSHFDSAIHYLNKEIKLLSSDSVLYQRYMTLGHYYGRYNDFKNAEHAYRAALTKLAFAPSTQDSISTYTYMGLSFAKQAKYDEGIVFVEKAITIALNSKDEKNKYQALYGKAHYYTLTQEWKKRKPLLPQLLKLSETIGDSSLIYNSLMIAVQSAEIFERFDSAEYFLNRAILINPAPSPLRYYDHLASMASIQEQMGKVKEAKENALNALMGFRDLNWDKTESANFVYEILGDIYLKEKDYDKAIEYFTLAYDNAKNGSNIARQKDYIRKLINTYKAQEKYAEMALLMEKHRELSDTLFRDFYEGRLAEAETRMGLLLKEKELESKNTQIAHQSTQQRLYLLLIGLLVLLTLGGLTAYWNIKKDRQVIARQKELLEHSLNEKSVLLKEIHHRVKNNLQIISSLLDKQARNSANQTVKQLMREGQDRIQSMALIHQNLYKSSNISGIDIKNYIQELVHHISKSQFSNHQKINISIEVDASRLNIDTAVPLGLVLNELLTNAYKHAFDGKTSGQIEVRFREKNNGKYELSVRDNGIGLQRDLDKNNLKGLGLNLVYGLVEQLEGVLDVNTSDKGTGFLIRF